MPPIKVMPLVLTAIASCAMVWGVARAAEQQIIIAQAQTPQQKEEEHQRKLHEQQQHNQQHNQQQQKPQQQQHQVPDKLQQQKALELQKAQQQQLQHQAQEKAQQQKLSEEQRKAKEQAEAAKLHNDQVKVQQLQQQQHNTEQQLHQQQLKSATQQHQALQQQNALHRELSAADLKAKAERDAHQQDRLKLIQQQHQMATTERSQASINERLRLQNEHLRAITSQRQQSVDSHGQTIIKEPGNRTIVQTKNGVFIQHDETANFKLFGGRPQTVRSANGNMVSTFARPDGVRIEVEVDTYGRPLRRVRILPDGRRFVLFENRAIAVGAGFALGAFLVTLPPPRIMIPRDQYIVDADVASEDDFYAALSAGPVEPLDRSFSLDEVLASVGLRERMRSISLDSINFEFGSWEVGPDQAVMLEPVAAVMRDMANQNPGEVFLIEGHTDAVGSDIDNLSLSDRRAEAIAQLLSEQFGIPRENLVTQGYGKQFLLIPTDVPERRNRRVVIRRITPLLQGDFGPL